MLRSQTPFPPSQIVLIPIPLVIRSNFGSTKMSAPRRSRAAYFASGDEESTAAVLARVLRPFGGFLATHAASVYSCSDMGGAHNVGELEAAAPLIKSLVELDPRGGLFSQPTVEATLRLCLDADGLLATHASYADSSLPEAQQLGMTAYKLRVMMNHIRAMADARISALWFLPIFEHIRDNASAVNIRARRVSRMQGRPRPFAFFREAAIDSDPLLEPEVATEVACFSAGPH